VIPAPVRFFLPTLAAMLAAVTLFYCLLPFGGGMKLFRDSDSGWHIRNGQSILARHALPATDPYSFSKPNQPWFAWEWAADVVMGAVDRFGGLNAVAGLFALTIAAATWLWVRLNFAMDGDFLLAGLFAPLMITTTSAHWLARPHVFSWILLLGWVIFLETPAQRGPLRSWVDSGLALIFGAMWANVHGSFFLAPALAAVYTVSHLMRPLLWPLDARAERAAARRYLWIALASAAGTLLNPYGWRLHAHVLTYLWDGRLTSQIAEFQPFPFHDAGAGQMMAVMGLAAIGGVLALAQKKLAQCLMAAIFLWGGLRSARALPLIALLILPIANSAIATAARQMRGLRQPLLLRLDAALAYSARLRRIDLRLNGVGFAIAAVMLSLLIVRAPAFAATVGFPSNAFPVAASQAVQQLPANARILTSDSYGGYLIYRFAGARKVFFDGRSDFYGADFLATYFTLSAARPGWRDIVARYHFTHALLPVSSTLAGALTQAGWKPLYQDPIAILLEYR
jgi:hypothetical protein